MNLLKYVSVAVIMIAGNLSICSAFADTANMPMLRTMAEPELRAETTGIIAYQQDPQEVRALQHRIMQIQMDTQNFVVSPTVLSSVDLVPDGPMPDINSLPPVLQQYVIAIAQGLQSPDPREGLYIMLEPFGIDRNAQNVQIAREQVKLGIVENTSQNSAPTEQQQ